MADNTLSLIGVLFLSILIAAAYFPLYARLSQPDFMAWAFGPMIVNMLFIMLSVLSVCFGLSGLYFLTQKGVVKR